MIRIMFVDADTERVQKMMSFFRENDYYVLNVSDASEALASLDKTDVRMIVANSQCGGIELTEELRNSGSTVPVIMLTSNPARSEMRRIFRSHADGYMVLPVDLEELLMRVRSLLWRCNIVEESSLRFGSCTLHSNSMTLETRNGDIELRHMEYLLLEKLISYPGKIFTRPQLMDDLWGYDSESDPRTVDTHIRRLRKKLSDIDDIRIQTVRGLGYRVSLPKKLRNAEKKS